jgi:DNA-binding XRE family transcriptional regulator
VNDEAAVMGEWIDATIAANVAMFRRQLGLSQNSLAKGSGMAPSMVAFIESRTRHMFSKTYPKLVVGLRVAPHVLLQRHPLVPCLSCHDTPEAGTMCTFCRVRGPDLPGVVAAFATTP